MVTAGKDRGEIIAQLQGVDFSYGANKVLEGVDLTVRRGDYLAVLGPNGGGKTTLVKLILGLIRPDAGQVRVFNAPPAQARGSIGYVPQYTNIRPDFPVSTLDVVLMGLATARSFGLRASSAERDKAMQALALVDMTDCADRRIGTLSGGQRQRVFIARALASGPDLLLMDEPTASVDAHARFCFYELLAELSDKVSVVVVSHDLSIVASRVTAIA
ncbi:MAG: ABC transporter ATP-binding protein, partial [Desulfocurvibacter africanus]